MSIDMLESLHFLSKTHRGELHERVKIEWKVLFATLTFYVSAVVVVLTGKVDSVNIKEHCYFVYVFFMLIASFVIYFLAHLHIANNMNKRFAKNAEDIIEKALNNEVPKKIVIFNDANDDDWSISGLPDGSKHAKYALHIQVVILLSFSFAAAYIITNIK